MNVENVMEEIFHVLVVQMKMLKMIMTVMIGKQEIKWIVL